MIEQLLELTRRSVQQFDEEVKVVARVTAPMGWQWWAA